MADGRDARAQAVLCRDATSSFSGGSARDGVRFQVGKGGKSMAALSEYSTMAASAVCWSATGLTSSPFTRRYALRPSRRSLDHVRRYFS